MGMYKGVPTIRTQIANINGRYMTKVWRNAAIIKEIYTDAKMIRTEESCLWKPGVPEEELQQGRTRKYADNRKPVYGENPQDIPKKQKKTYPAKMGKRSKQNKGNTRQ